MHKTSNNDKFLAYMIQIDALQNKEVIIEDFNATFVILNFENKKLRFDFYEKQEAILKQKDRGILYYYTEHPLLINHNESHLDVYINSAPVNPELFIEDVKNAINEVLKGWRNWKEYIEINSGINFQVFLENVKNGRGKLLKAPFAIIKEIEDICQKHDVKIKSFGDHEVHHNKMIMINQQFVITKDFKLSE